MRKFFLLSFLLVGTGLPISGQQPAPSIGGQGTQALPPDAPSREQVLKTFVHPEQMRKNLNTVFGAIKKQIQQGLQREGRASAEELKFIDDLFDTTLNAISIDDLVNAMVGVYQKHFTAADIDAIAAFEASPLGEKLRNGQSELMTQMIQAMDPEQEKAMAAKPLPANAPTREQLLKFFNAVQMRKTLMAVINISKERTKASAAEAFKSRGMDPNAASMSIDSAEEERLDHVLDVTLKLYQRYFTAAEVDTLTAFYLSPVGQKFLAVVPEIAAESSRVMAPAQQRIMQMILDKIKAHEEEVRENSGHIYSTTTPK